MDRKAARQELSLIIAQAYEKGTRDALKAVGRSLNEVPAASYKRCLDRWYETHPIIVDGCIVYPEFSDEALTQMRWG